MTGREPTRDSLLGPSLLLTGGRLAAFAVSFCVPLVLTRVFPPADVGTYKQIFLLYYTIYFIAQTGMAESLFYFLPASPRDGGPLVANAMVFLGAAGLAASAALVAFGGPISRGLGNVAVEPLLPFVGVFLTATMASSVLEIVLISRSRHLAAASIYGSSDAVKAICLLVPAALTRDLRWVMAGAAAFAAIRLGTALAVLGRDYGPRLRPDRALFRRQMAYAAPFGAAVLIDAIQANFHQFAVSHRFDPATYAIYAVGCLQIPFVDFVAAPACNLMMVGMQESLRRGDADALARLWTETTGRIAEFVVPVMVGLLVVGHELIVALFTRTYAASGSVFAVWTLSLLPAVVQTDGVLRVFARTRFLLALSVVKLAVIALTVGPLLSALGLPGAAAAAVLTLAVAKAVALAKIRGLLGVGIGELLPWRRLARVLGTAAAAAAPSWLARNALGAPVADVVLGATLYAAAYAALFFSGRAALRRGRVSVPGWVSR